jgi:hypothetical protein
MFSRRTCVQYEHDGKLPPRPLKWLDNFSMQTPMQMPAAGSQAHIWVVFQWNTNQLNSPGSDNVLTFHVDRTQGVMYDALRMEVTNRSAAHEATSWNDYEYVNSGAYEPANDGIANNNRPPVR